MNPSRHTTGICIAGWHFPESYFRSMREVRNADLYVVSHRPRQDIPAYVFDVVPEAQVFIEPNFGYDWGCYQQFLGRDLWRNYDYMVFLHDDLQIRRPDFVEAGIERLSRHAVIGNGRVLPPRDWPASHPESYLHASWRPAQPSFEHDVVRGSFFMTTRDALAKLGGFEVFWDRHHASPYFGNWSTRASCAKWQDRCGPGCFGFLSEQGFESEWILELSRGLDLKHVVEHPSNLQRFNADIIYRLSRFYMRRAWRVDREPGPFLRAMASVCRRAGSLPS